MAVLGSGKFVIHGEQQHAFLQVSATRICSTDDPANE